MSLFTVGPDRVLSGWWAVRDHNGTVARRLTRWGQQRKACPAVFRTEVEANDFCAVLNAHLAAVPL